MGGDEAKRLYQYFLQKVQDGYKPERVKDGVFQAMMEVALVNDGPVSPPYSPSSNDLTTYPLGYIRAFYRCQTVSIQVSSRVFRSFRNI
jgi:hypothetical protein